MRTAARAVTTTTTDPGVLPNRLWAWDVTHFTRPRRVSFRIVGVSR